MYRQEIFKLIFAVSALLSVVVPTRLGASETDTLTLRVNDAAGDPGGRVAIVLRTYASRGIEQGQICLRASLRRKAAGLSSPLATLEEVLVFSAIGDAESLSAFDEIGQTAIVEFTSPSGTVNQSDGPVAAFIFRLDSSLLPGDEFEILIDPADTFLVDAGGGNVTTEFRAGILEVRAPGEAHTLGVDAEPALPGEIAILGAETQDLFAVGSGQITVLYDPQLATGPAQVVMDPRHGTAFFTVDDSVAGRISVSFQSPDGSLNRLPGSLVSIRLPTSAALPPGMHSLVELDPAATWLRDPDGGEIALELVGDVFTVGGDSIFADGFESGGLSSWTTSTR